MPHCPNCNQKWNLKKTLKAHGEHNLGTACPNCKEVSMSPEKQNSYRVLLQWGI